MEQKEIGIVGKVFEVVGGKRKCLVCDGVFMPTQAANHATAPCYPLLENVRRFKSKGWSISRWMRSTN